MKRIVLALFTVFALTAVADAGPLRGLFGRRGGGCASCGGGSAAMPAAGYTVGYSTYGATGCASCGQAGGYAAPMVMAAGCPCQTAGACGVAGCPAGCVNCPANAQTVATNTIVCPTCGGTGTLPAPARVEAATAAPTPQYAGTLPVPRLVAAVTPRAEHGHFVTVCDGQSCRQVWVRD